MTDAHETSNIEQVAAMRNEQWAFGLAVIIFLWPFFVWAFVVFAPINNDTLIEHATALAEVVPGLKKSSLNIQQYSSELNAAKFVMVYFWSFMSDCVLAVALGLVFSLISKLHRLKNTKKIYPFRGLTVPRDSGAMVQPALTILLLLIVFFFAPVAYVPSASTSVGKAYFGATFAAVGMSLLAAIFLFQLTVSLISSGLKVLSKPWRL